MHTSAAASLAGGSIVSAESAALARRSGGTNPLG